ncbi:MAG: translation initiation factor IF-1 [Myxococcales bacterium]|nr:translation initiation factor IF-1 [Myxococcales bacterium]
MAGREAEGTVDEVLPGGLYRVSLEHGEKIRASIGGIARQTTVRVIAGDRVIVEISPLDPTRGKIKRRLG